MSFCRYSHALAYLSFYVICFWPLPIHVQPYFTVFILVKRHNGLSTVIRQIYIIENSKFKIESGDRLCGGRSWSALFAKA